MLIYKINKNIRQRIKVKKTAVVLLAVVALAAAGCRKGRSPEVEAPRAACLPSRCLPQMPEPGGDLVGLKPQEIPAGVSHKGKVLETMNAGGYTYVQVDEKGRNWLVMETKVKVGAPLKFPTLRRW
jgi:hypothetical protein